MGPLFFDPEGADFTAWINHFKNEVYRNWIVPQAALLRLRRGHVDFEFTVERDGSLSDLRMLKSSGTPALDRAAAERPAGQPPAAAARRLRARRASRMQVTFYLQRGPAGLMQGRATDVSPGPVAAAAIAAVMGLAGELPDGAAPRAAGACRPPAARDGAVPQT